MVLTTQEVASLVPQQCLREPYDYTARSARKQRKRLEP
jgi:hypothetical protein